jgi:DNA mismatch repair ATPase MutL
MKTRNCKTTKTHQTTATKQKNQQQPSKANKRQNKQQPSKTNNRQPSNAKQQQPSTKTTRNQGQKHATMQSSNTNNTQPSKTDNGQPSNTNKQTKGRTNTSKPKQNKHQASDKDQNEKANVRCSGEQLLLEKASTVHFGPKYHVDSQQWKQRFGSDGIFPNCDRSFPLQAHAHALQIRQLKKCGIRIVFLVLRISLNETEML